MITVWLADNWPMPISTAGQLSLWTPQVEIDLVIAKTYTPHFSKVAN